MATQFLTTQPEEFSLAAAIFVPFEGIPEDFRPAHDGKNGNTVLENLVKSKDDVKRNMIFLAKLKQDKILEEAKDALKADEQDEGFRRKRESGYMRDREDLLDSVKRARKSLRDEGSKRQQGRGDVEMGGTDSSTKSTNGSNSTSQQVGRKLEDLFESSVRELDAYDKFTEGIIQGKREEMTPQQQTQRLQEAGAKTEDVFAQRRTSAPTAPSTGGTSARSNTHDRLSERRSSGQTRPSDGVSPTADSYNDVPRRSWSDSHPSTSNFNSENQRLPPDSWGPPTGPSHSSGRDTYNQGRGDYNASRGPSSSKWAPLPRLRKKHHKEKIVTCVFWMQNRCLAGDDCSFRHDHEGQPPDMTRV